MVVQRFSEVARTIIFVDNLSLYPTVKKISKLVNSYNFINC